jgi:adenylate cyclase
MFGDTVNVANRMESTGLPERIHLSDDTYQRLTNREQYIFEERGEIEIKGKGIMRTYFLLNRKSSIPHGTPSRTNTMTHLEV